jgi:hypothetical protein
MSAECSAKNGFLRYQPRIRAKFWLTRLLLVNATSQISRMLTAMLAKISDHRKRIRNGRFCQFPANLVFKWILEVV